MLAGARGRAPGRVAPDAVLRHAEASARERRPIDCVGRSARPSPTRFARRSASPHRVDKAGAVYTLLANAPGRSLLYVMLRLVLGTLLRILAYLVGKAPGQALDEVAGFIGTASAPGTNPRRPAQTRKGHGRSGRTAIPLPAAGCHRQGNRRAGRQPFRR